MKGFKIYSKADVAKRIAFRKGEIKFGENLKFVDSIQELEDSPAKYVLFGIPEDIGVRANHGKKGASKAWEAVLNTLVNIQQNRFNNPEHLVLLGEVDCRNFMGKAANIGEDDPNYLPKLGDIVKEIDQIVADVIQKIITAGKIPLIIGGGHNNAYGNIKGASKALGDPIDVVNIDAHTDLRQLEHRHSGNGFSYAIEGGYLRKYSVFGIHKNYTPEYIFEQMEYSENMEYFLLEKLIKFQDEIGHRFTDCLEKHTGSKFGLELDCDAIAKFPSSAQSPVGFSENDIRKMIKIVSKIDNCCYFHICEAAPSEENKNLVGKSLSYFVIDFISKI